MTKALFLDRDGIINVEKNYVHKIHDFEFMPGIFDFCRHYQSFGFKIFVITNQAGIARGYYSVGDFDKLTDWMLERFEYNGVNVEKVYFCPHHPEFSGICSCRKPESGMILQAANEYAIDLSNSILVGDKMSDVEAGKKAGVGTLILTDSIEKLYI